MKKIIKIIYFGCFICYFSSIILSIILKDLNGVFGWFCAFGWCMVSYLYEKENKK